VSVGRQAHFSALVAVACIDRASHDARVSFAMASEKRDRDGAIRRAFAEWRASADERRRSPSVAAA